jgi:hypothetical protein
VSDAGSKRKLPLEIEVYRRFALPSNRLTSQARAHPFERRSGPKVTSTAGFTSFLQIAGNCHPLSRYLDLQAIDSPWAQIGRRLRPQAPAFFFSLPFFLFVLKEAPAGITAVIAVLPKHAQRVV